MNIEHRTSNIERRTAGRWYVRAALGFCVAGMILSVSSGAQETNNYPALNSFNIIGQRNIFDPFRTGYVARENNTGRRPRVDAFALVGTMSYSKGRFAFFDGSNFQYKKVIEAGGNIAGYTVKEVGQDAVTLAANGKEFQMKIGTQMRNQGNNKWELSGHIIDDTPADGTNGDTNGETNGENAAANSTTPPAGGSPEMNDVLKRLMQQRQQELK
jgi:hypothetical protein